MLFFGRISSTYGQGSRYTLFTGTLPFVSIIFSPVLECIHSKNILMGYSEVAQNFFQFWKQNWKPKHEIVPYLTRWFWTVVLEKILESPLDCKEIQPVHPKGNQSWIFIGRTDAEAPIFPHQPPDVKNWLTGKDPDAGKDWRREEKGTM